MGFERLALKVLVRNLVLCKLKKICIKLISILSLSHANAATYLISLFKTLVHVNHTLSLAYYCTHLLKSTNTVLMKISQRQYIATISKSTKHINCHSRLAIEYICDVRNTNTSNSHGFAQIKMFHKIISLSRRPLITEIAHLSIDLRKERNV